VKSAGELAETNRSSVAKIEQALRRPLGRARISLQEVVSQPDVVLSRANLFTVSGVASASDLTITNTGTAKVKHRAKARCCGMDDGTKRTGISAGPFK
jgi:hypothetical protein